MGSAFDHMFVRSFMKRSWLIKSRNKRDIVFWLMFYSARGKGMTSLMLEVLVNNMINLSTPIAVPAEGGNPCSIALRKS